ncbi:hypothetical protein RF11_16044 [Thelohanellus kitauei]|uniref:Uncharacterized protein n=1 Tax=Thelohanellus kitauei TaxID=669202 RepID=A0A0C2MQH3_THEKT|nr:hypothetical protein RF11_16044 [Thelohanellus kitauei]
MEDRKVPIERWTFNFQMWFDQDLFKIRRLLGVNEKPVGTAQVPYWRFTWHVTRRLCSLAYLELDSAQREKIAKYRIIEGLQSAYVKRSLISFSSDKNIADLLTQAPEI